MRWAFGVVFGVARADALAGGLLLPDPGARKGPADGGPARLDDKGYLAGGLMSLYPFWISSQVAGS